MKDLLHHLFLPRESNNHRSKLLHHTSIIFVIAILFIGQFVIGFFKTNLPAILGTNIDISSQELLLFTNLKREDESLHPLTLNEELSRAAYLKARDMFENDYWAHTSPTGTTPWHYFKLVNYDYAYAGENLARGFNKSDGIVNAWMASPSHRENVLSQNYNEVGFAIVEGKLSGEETVLVVEMFGGRNKFPLASKVSKDRNLGEAVSTSPKPVSYVASLTTKSIIDSKALSKNIAFLVLTLFIVAFILDMIIIKRARIVRFVGHNVDHIVFLAAILLIVIFYKGGITL